MRVGALGDVLLTRRLNYSLSLAGFRVTLFAPEKHACLLTSDPWIERVINSDGVAAGAAFSGEWRSGREFDSAVVISDSEDLRCAAKQAAATVVSLSPLPMGAPQVISLQWALAASAISPAFEASLPDLPTVPELALASDATIIHVGSGSARKNWPIERFVAISRELEQSGHHVMWLRGPAEIESWPLSLPFAILDQPSLQALAATLSVARLFIGNDSGVSHLAGAVGARTLALFGPTDARIWRPDGRNVSTLQDSSQTLSAISVDDALAAVDSFLKLPA